MNPNNCSHCDYNIPREATGRKYEFCLIHEIPTNDVTTKCDKGVKQ